MKKRERIAQLERELDAWRREAQAGGRAIKRLERDLAASRETSVKMSGVCDRLRGERDSARAERDTFPADLSRLERDLESVKASRDRLAAEVHRLMVLRAGERVPSQTVPLPGPRVTCAPPTIPDPWDAALSRFPRVEDLASTGFCRKCGMSHELPAVHLDGSPVAVRPVP